MSTCVCVCVHASYYTPRRRPRKHPIMAKPCSRRARTPEEAEDDGRRGSRGFPDRAIEKRRNTLYLSRSEQASFVALERDLGRRVVWEQRRVCSGSRRGALATSETRVGVENACVRFEYILLLFDKRGGGGGGEKRV